MVTVPYIQGSILAYKSFTTMSEKHLGASDAMQHLFTRANDALCEDLERYVSTLRVIVVTLPKAKVLCERVVAEVRLVQALLAFGDALEAAPLQQIALQVSNLWGVREDLPARATGFGNQIAESVHARGEAMRAISLISKRMGDSLAGELRICFENIIQHLDAQQQMLSDCEARLRPFQGSPELTRKRLNLLIAAAEARLPDTPSRRSAVVIYAEAAALLSEWEGGITLDERGIAVLERCLDLLSQSPAFGFLSIAGDAQRSSAAE